jgi:hypothetical protein
VSNASTPVIRAMVRMSFMDADGSWLFPSYSRSIPKLFFERQHSTPGTGQEVSLGLAAFQP